MFGRKKDKDVIFTNLIDHEKRIKELEQKISERGMPMGSKEVTLIWSTSKINKEADGFVCGAEIMSSDKVEPRIKELEKEYKKDNLQYKIAD
jgi:hypothetical protein